MPSITMGSSRWIVEGICCWRLIDEVPSSLGVRMTCETPDRTEGVRESMLLRRGGTSGRLSEYEPTLGYELDVAVCGGDMLAGGGVGGDI